MRQGSVSGQLSGGSIPSGASPWVQLHPARDDLLGRCDPSRDNAERQLVAACPRESETIPNGRWIHPDGQPPEAAWHALAEHRPDRSRQPLESGSLREAAQVEYGASRVVV